MQAATGRDTLAIQLTQEEAFALLTLCMLSAHEGDKAAENALRKLADYCKHFFHSDNAVR